MQDAKDPAADEIRSLRRDVAHLAADNTRLLSALDELRHNRIYVLPAERASGGGCVLGCGGSYTLASQTTLLELRADQTVVRIDHVPVDECDRCGHTLVTLETAATLERLLDSAHTTDPPTGTTPMIRLDYLDHR